MCMSNWLENLGDATVIQDGTEITARTAALKSGTYIELNPGIQRITNSNTRIEFCYGFSWLVPLSPILLRHGRLEYSGTFTRTENEWTWNMNFNSQKTNECHIYPFSQGTSSNSLIDFQAMRRHLSAITKKLQAMGEMNCLKRYSRVVLKVLCQRILPIAIQEVLMSSKIIRTQEFISLSLAMKRYNLSRRTFYNCHRKGYITLHSSAGKTFVSVFELEVISKEIFAKKRTFSTGHLMR